MSRVQVLQLAFLAAVSLLAVVPFFWLGIPSGHDFEFHLYSWMEVLGQWKQGIAYPHWGALEHWGYGEARFIFYPPISWTLGATLGSMLPWQVAPGVYIWIAIWLSALSMFYSARNWMEQRDALFAAVFYAFNPYHVVIIYWRSAFAELLAPALLPLLLLWTIRLNEKTARPVLWLSLILALAWLTNAPAAVMVHYSLAVLALMIAVANHSWRTLIKAAAAIALGAGLASFYLLPAVYEQKWVNINEVLAPGVRPQDNFLFTKVADPDHNRFNLFVSVVAAAEIAAGGLALWLSRKRRNQSRVVWVVTSLWMVTSGVIMFRVTHFFWEYLPKLRFVQLPWRWLLCLNVGLAILLALAVRRWKVRLLLATVLIGGAVFAAYRIQPPWWDHAADVQAMASDMRDGIGNEGTDEYVPAGADPYEIKQGQRRVALCEANTSPANCICGVGLTADDCNLNPRRVPSENATAEGGTRTEIVDWGADYERFRVRAPNPENLTLRQFHYPAWAVTIDGRPVRAGTTDVTGQMVIPVPAGSSDVEIRFVRTLDRTVGIVVSCVSLIFFISLWLIAKRGINSVKKPASTI